MTAMTIQLGDDNSTPFSEPGYIPGQVVRTPREWVENDLPTVYSVAVMYLGNFGALVSSFYVRGMPGQAKYVAESVRQMINPPYTDLQLGKVFINVWSIDGGVYFEMVQHHERTYTLPFDKEKGFAGNVDLSVHTDDTEV